MRDLKDKDGILLEEDEAKAEALAKQHFCWEEEGRQVGEEEENEDGGGPGYTIEELVGKLRGALQGTSNSSAPGPDNISYRFMKALVDTVFGNELLIQMARELQKGKAPTDWQLSKVIMIPKPGKVHTQLKG